MTDERRNARIHNILYSTDSREELAQRIVALEDERDKVSKERDYLLMNANPTATELRRVRRAWKNDRAENAKLRELVNDMWICISHGSGWDCTGCMRDPDNVCIMGISEFSQRMRELGIEVGHG